MSIPFQPTYLYIKQHAVTGKCYFGKTTSQNPVKYLGSGLHWLRHLKVHGKEHVGTLWYELFTEYQECTKFALEFSEKMDIVKSDQWLNIKPENGIDGGRVIGHPVSASTRAKISLLKKNKKLGPQSVEHRIKRSASMIGKNKGNKRPDVSARYSRLGIE